ncbi:hypothetical protein [Microvirga tunisiensis]|uniref:Uncharacterized protein n=1 Tax=Microvirga tunisiensis TaxID=2108360 RepID=A0A5N7MCV1_9HYPH|nr:hypothetical protein [Microvirga tunisiensis]MPR06313.1 hypothetical protein [Microvirga tunisiensis]MPR24099.1 hypothetical protein [Microvirga tunisiensis]
MITRSYRVQVRDADQQVHDETVEVESEECNSMLDDALEAGQAACKSVAASQTDFDAFDNDSAYLETIDRRAGACIVENISKVGTPVRFSVYGLYSNDGGAWSDCVFGVDHEDAMFDAKWQMAENQGSSVERDGLEDFLDTMEGIEITDCIPEPVTKDELADAAKDVVLAFDAKQPVTEAVGRLRDMLKQLGVELERPTVTHGA